MGGDIGGEQENGVGCGEDLAPDHPIRTSSLSLEPLPFMTAAQFRKLALSFQGVEESAHHGHADFRCYGKVFASLGYPSPEYGMVKLDPELQAALMREDPEVYSPAAGAWGRQGSTLVRLKKAKLTALRAVMKMIAGRHK